MHYIIKTLENSYFFYLMSDVNERFPVNWSERQARRECEAMDDKQIVDLYWSRTETAIAETEKKYGRYCHYIAYQILYNDEDSMLIVNDTYMKTWNTIPPQRPDSLKSYVGMISRQLALNEYDKLHTQKRGGQVMLVLDELSECIPDENSGKDMGESIALSDSLNRFLWSLPKRTRNLFVRRYFYMSSISEIAEDFRMKESNVSMNLLRTRKKLQQFLIKEGFEL